MGAGIRIFPRMVSPNLPLGPAGMSLSMRTLRKARAESFPGGSIIMILLLDIWDCSLIVMHCPVNAMKAFATGLLP